MSTSRERYREGIFMCYDVERRGRSSEVERLTGGGEGRGERGMNLRGVRNEVELGAKIAEVKAGSRWSGRIGKKIERCQKAEEPGAGNFVEG
ncbi:MAG: hypothetical protein ACE5R6_00910 [Candidatus Heimdallarchaeota archaeon]